MGIKNERVLIQAAHYNFPAIWGVRKTVAGVRVVEVHSGYYFTPCLKAYTSRNEQGGWFVASADDRSDSGEIHSRRADALAALEHFVSLVAK
jgi:hypothetical protein